MRPTFLGFETARRGLMVSQKGLDITGQNLTNVKTPGYTRQRIDLYAVAPSSYQSRYATNRTPLAGQGVDASGVSQTRDSFLDKRFRDEYGDVGYYDQVSSVLGDIESALDEYDAGTGLLNAITEINKALNNFSNSNADSKTHANIVASAFKNITQVLHQFDTKLNNVAEQQKTDLELAVNDVNGMLEKVAALNRTISEDASASATSPGEYYGPNELLDERNLLLDELSRCGDLDVTQNADGTVTLNMNGHTVVEGKKAESINFFRNSNGTVTLAWQSDGKAIELTKGSLKGATDMINGRGVNARASNETVQNGILYFKDKINTFASTLVQTINHILPKTDASGEIEKDASGNIVYKTLLAGNTQAVDGSGKFITSTDIPITASNISLSDEWAKDSSYVIFREGDKDSTYAIAMSKALTNDSQIAFTSAGERFTGTFSDFVKDYVGTYGTDKAFNDGRMNAAASIADSLLDRRDQISAVEPDEETTNMMLYQKSYQAIARLMTTLDEALDVLINRTGLVGR
ncbi:flagellar hook-associated protein FlgK [Oscillospiraceae bacterium PP1C4]